MSLAVAEMSLQSAMVCAVFRNGAIALSLTLLSACVPATVLSGPKNVNVDLSRYRSVQERPLQDSSLALAVAISGGGHRAGNYGIGVLTALEMIQVSRATILAEIDYISTVSGGGLAAAFLISKEAGRLHVASRSDSSTLAFSFFEACGSSVSEERVGCLRPVLRQNLEAALWRRITSPRILFGPWTSGDALEKAMDDKFLSARQNGGRSLTLDDIFIPVDSPYRVRLPFWVANGTVFENGAIFPFTPDVLRAYGVSEYNHRMRRRISLDTAASSFPLAVGLKASASFPVIIPNTVVSVRRNESDSIKTGYLRLLDGGLADNLGVLTALDLLRHEKHVRKKALLVIDAYPGTGFPFSTRDRSELPFTVLRRIGDIGLESWHGKQGALIPVLANKESVSIVYLGFDQLLRQLANPSLQTLDDRCSRLAAAEPLPTDPQELVSLNEAARTVGTRLKISPEKQRTLLRAGRLVVLVNCRMILDSLSTPNRPSE